MPEEKDDWLDDLEDAIAASPESGPAQSDLSSLLIEDEAQTPAPSPGEEAQTEADELDQSAIDALLSGGDGAAAEAGELSQSDLDTLLVSPQTPAPAKETADPDQDEIDKLFSEADSLDAATEVPFPESETDFKDLFDGQEPAAPSPTPAPPLDFDSDEFKLDTEIPDIPDSIGLASPPAEPPPPADEATAVAEPPPEAAAPSPAGEEAPPALAPSAVAGLGAGLALLLAKRRLLLGAGLLALLLLIGGGLFFARHRRTAPVPPAVQEETAPVPAAPEPARPPGPPPPAAAPAPGVTAIPPPAAPAPPVVADLDLTLPADSQELVITLHASDPDNRELSYDFVSMPQHGQLSGQAPNLIYTPQPGFSGQDSFSVKAGNGASESAPATVRITRLAPTKAAPPETKAEAKEETIRAQDASYTVTGGQGRRIDWRRLWRAANRSSETYQARVDILTPPRHGDVRLKGEAAIYRPASGFAGADTLRYRFRLGSRMSEPATLTLRVIRPHPPKPPVIHLQALAPEYQTGDTVSLNASQTLAGSRPPGLIFTWEQQSGPPVRLRALDESESRVDFVAPAFFSNEDDPRLTFLLTVTAPNGQSASREVVVRVKSRRHSALWGQDR